MHQSRIFNVANMSLNAIDENKIIAKTSEFIYLRPNISQKMKTRYPNN